ncbi:MAG: SDR family oxidoreductase [Chloroflexi bacterium]|nr:SDR family oxidoreductase [Chloroflexota bacterium]
MAGRLQGKRAVVTGGGHGIGKAVALALALEGAKVVVNDVGREPDGGSSADQVAREIAGAKGVAVANHDTVATMAGGESIIETACERFGGIDILVNSAANRARMKCTETTEEVWDSVMAVHLKGHFSCTQAAAREMIRQKTGGRIINFSSRGAFYVSSGNLCYATAKGGILGFTAMWAFELKEHGITVNCMLPSATTHGPLPVSPKDEKPLGDGIPVPLRTEPDFVAPIVVYLATDKAKDITGQFIYAAGGDIAFYAKPFQLANTHRFLRKSGKWTLEELDDLIPNML